MDDLIGRYEVEPSQSMIGKILGQGTFARVTREKDPNDPANAIAVKRFDWSTGWSSFMREVTTLIRLKHPCIVQILGWSQRGARSFAIRMPVAVGGALSDYIGCGRLALLGRLQDPTRQACIICDIVLGMKWVHSHGMMHRDLKPLNILVDKNWRAVICDFGMSLSGLATGLPSPFRGTWEYAAPEQWEPHGPYTEKVDIFAFGVVVYEIITGQSCRWAGGSRLSPLPDPPAGYGSLIQNLIRECWLLEPSHRPSFQEIFDRFKSSEWAILPGADARAIAKSVWNVISLQNQLVQNTP
jgi:serine/threonine protein kinase